LQCFEIIIQSHPSLSALLQPIQQSIAKGNSLSKALTQFPKHFDPVLCQLIHAGEQSGTLDNMLKQIVLYKEKTAHLKSKIKKAMTYPLAIISIALIITVFMLTYVVPTFADLFDQFGAKLPAFTQGIIELSNGIKDYGIMVAVMMGLLFVGSRYLIKQSVTMKQRWQTLLLKIPIAGVIIKYASIARITRTLSTTLSAGLPLIQSLDIASETTAPFKQALLAAKKDVINGAKLEEGLQRTGSFPGKVIQLVKIGEQSGSLDKLLANIAQFYENSVDDKVDQLNSLLEPFIMIVLGLLIGALVVAMYLPIFKLGNAI